MHIDCKNIANAQQSKYYHKFLCGSTKNNRIANLGIIWTRIGSQWGDDVNSYKIEPWNTFDLRIWREFFGVKFSLDVFDLLDNPYIDKKGLMSPGRYFLFTVGYSFEK